MTTVFVSLLEKGMREGVFAGKIADARNWLRNQASQAVTTASAIIKGAEDAQKSKTAVGKQGRLILFSYDPKEKIKARYYDRFPIVFPFTITSTGFYGINLHYLPFQYRAVLMDNLYILLNNEKYDETTKLRLTYEILSSYSRLRFFRPCVKHYLNSQIRSSILTVPSSQWDIALFLPVERFVKASRSVVHMESVKTIRGI